jgi:hypothetical protein
VHEFGRHPLPVGRFEHFWRANRRRNAGSSIGGTKSIKCTSTASTCGT